MNKDNLLRLEGLLVGVIVTILGLAITGRIDPPPALMVMFIVTLAIAASSVGRLARKR